MGRKSNLKYLVALGVAAAGSMVGAMKANASPVVATSSVTSTPAASPLDSGVTPAYVPPPRSPFVPPLRGGGS
jgi:hypothetical protein